MNITRKSHLASKYRKILPFFLIKKLCLGRQKGGFIEMDFHYNKLNYLIY